MTWVKIWRDWWLGPLIPNLSGKRLHNALSSKCSLSTSNTAFTVCVAKPCPGEKMSLWNWHPSLGKRGEIILGGHEDNYQQSQYCQKELAEQCCLLTAHHTAVLANFPYFETKFWEELDNFQLSEVRCGDTHTQTHTYAFFLVYFPYFEKNKRSHMRSPCCLCVSVCQLVGQVNCCWPLPAQSFLVLSPVGLMTIFMTLVVVQQHCASVSCLHNFGADCRENIPPTVGCVVFCVVNIVSNKSTR
jgi:hypothetical protein